MRSEDATIMRTIEDAALDAFIEVDSYLLIAEWNTQAEESFGWRRTEALGKDLCHFISLVTEDVREILIGKRGHPSCSRRLEAVGLHRDGNRFPIALSISPIQRGQEPHLVMFARDLTALKKMEEQLFESHERYQAILDGIEDGYDEADLKGNYTFVNAAFCRMYGRVWEHQEAMNLKPFTTPEETVGNNFREYSPPESAQEIIDVYKQVYKTGKPATHDFKFAVGPKTFYTEQSITLKKDREGKVTGFRVLSRDCTERKMREQELARAKEVVEAAKQAAEEARIAAEKASRAKSEFLANMSHEIRTPMNAIMGMTELVLATELTGEQREFLSMAKSAADSLLVVLNDILDYSKIEAGKVVLDPAPFNLSDAVTDAVKILTLAARQKGIELALHVEADVPPAVVGDATRLRQVMINLIGNAIKFTAKGEVVVRLGVEESGKTSAKLHFSVRDTGIGISPENQKKLFKAFEQADISTARQYGGTGLGLAISSQIVRLMDGRIWLDSAVGVGSTFHFTVQLPVAPGTAESAKSEAAPSLAARIGIDEIESQPGLRILLAEDNAINQRLAVAMLSRMGHQVTSASTGHEVMLKLKDDEFDLILMDVQMPEMDGLAAASRIRLQERATGSHIPIIAMTANAMAGDREMCIAAGMDDYITKPINGNDLKQAISRLKRDCVRR